MALLLASLAVPGFGPGDHLARWLAFQLERAADEEVPPLLEQASQLDLAGLPVLVRALGSSRDAMASAAAAELQAQLDRWRTWDAYNASLRVACLARELSTQVESFPPLARQRAAEFTTQILHWPLDSQAAPLPSVLSDCERILEIVASNEETAETPRIDLSHYRPDGGFLVTADPPASWGDPSSSGEAGRLDRVAQLPGGDLPLDVRQVPATPPRPRPADGDELRRPERIFPPDSALPLSTDESPGRVDPTSARPLPPARDQESSAPARRTSADDLQPALARQAALEQMEDVALMRQLRTLDEVAADAARGELVRRGFDPLHLNLALRLVDPNVDVRRELAEALPRMQGVDAVPWLMQLASDENPTVRRTAIGILATRDSPLIDRWLREIARSERDATVKAVIEQRLQRR